MEMMEAAQKICDMQLHDAQDEPQIRSDRPSDGGC
jgi:hypothetical protein